MNTSFSRASYGRCILKNTVVGLVINFCLTGTFTIALKYLFLGNTIVFLCQFFCLFENILAVLIALFFFMYSGFLYITDSGGGTGQTISNSIDLTNSQKKQVFDKPENTFFKNIEIGKNPITSFNIFKILLLIKTHVDRVKNFSQSHSRWFVLLPPESQADLEELRKRWHKRGDSKRLIGLKTYWWVLGMLWGYLQCKLQNLLF